MPDETTQSGASDVSGDLSVESLLGMGGDEAPISQTPVTDQTKEPKQDAGDGFQVAGRSYKSREDFEKSYRSLTSEFSKRSERLKKLEGLFQNPDVAQALSQNSELSDALAEAGVELRKALAEEEAASGEASKAQEGETDENSLDYRLAVLEWRTTYDRQRAELEGELKRSLSKEEKAEIVKTMNDIPALSIKQAWQLANFQNAQKEAYNKAKSEAEKRMGKRPAPIPAILPGQRLDTKKPVHEMNRGEFREHAREWLAEQGM